MDSIDLEVPGYMAYCVVISCISSFSNGWVIGSANVPGEVTHACESAHTINDVFPDCLPMNTSLWGFAVSSFCVGGLIGGLSGGHIQMKFGRKKTILFNNMGWILGATLIGTAVSPAMFIMGRILCGLSCGLGSLATPTYIGEISTIKARGSMGTLNQFAIVTGILLASIVGLPLAKVPLWRINYALVAVPAIAQFFLMATCVETPRYLITINHIEEAKESLQRLRPNSSIDKEFYGMVEGQLGTKAAQVIVGIDHVSVNKGFLDEIEDSVIAQDEGTRSPMGIIQVFRDPLICRIALTTIALHSIQQLVGMNAVMYYSTTIFDISFSPEMSKYMAILTTVVVFVFTIVSLFLIDRMGRRPLLMLSEAGICLFSVLLVLGYVYNVASLLIFAVFGYVLSFAIGVGSIPWMITSELTPVYASSAVGAVATATNWAMGFLIGQCFPVIFESIKGYSFAIFACVAALAFTFTWLKVPETKGRSLEDIVKRFEKTA